MKKILLTILQLAVTIAVLYYVFHDPKKLHQMREALEQADYPWVVAAVGAYIVVEIAAALRWQILLRVQGIYLSWARLSGLFLIGDIIKSYLLLKETPDKKAGALLAVLFDRLIGLLALVVITAVLIFLRYHWLTQTSETRHYVWPVLAALAISILGLAMTFLISGFNLAQKLPRESPAREKLIEISAAYHLYARHWTGSIFAFLISLVAHLATFTTFLFVAYTLRADVRLVDFFAVMPIERTVSAIPISFAGEGPREHILQIMLSGLCGVPPGVAALIGTMSFLIILFCCVPGGIVYFFYKPSGEIRHVRMREMETEVATLEHEIGRSE